ncbi:MAG TPA: NAD(P)H-dependent glycerol-3-phosphate dehydrogenase [Chthoniobacteraceae bacterium]|nr:NAD(P)H-dependent glycerol-3-phosphate dehydrogenase [Chthoniobacteraceae bacterium]
MSFQKIGVIGAGGWGTALSVLLSERGVPVAIWGYDKAEVAAMAGDRENKTFLPGVKLPENIHPTTAFSDVADADVVIMVTPSRHLGAVAQQLAKSGLSQSAILLSCTKGIEQGTGARMSELITAAFPLNRVAVLSGPSHAEEVSRKMPTAVVIGSANTDVAQELQRFFSTKFFRAYTSEDVAGIELGGALKNIFAIAAGMSDGMGFGDNSKAALVTRSLAELIRLGTALGGKRETFQGLSGIGDLMVTCFSRHSRNRSFGERLGRGESAADIAKSMTMVAEGVPNTLSAFECARRLNLETPIIDQMHAILYENKPPHEAMRELLMRELRPEED